MKINVLDHGYVEFIEAWGHGDGGRYGGETVEHDMEAGIIEAARQSTQGAFRGWEQDAKLLRRLWRGGPEEATPLPSTPRHASPFEFAGMVIEVQLPIFVCREWHRHRTQSYNEASARYAPLPDLYYVPTAERLMAGHGGNKQAQGLDPNSELQRVVAEGFVAAIQEFNQQVEKIYRGNLDAGLPKEIARVVMPVGHYTRMRACANLRSWLNFLELRLDAQAQWEIRQYAYAVGNIVEHYFPHTWELFSAAHGRQ